MRELMQDHGIAVVGTAIQRSLKKYGVNLYLAKSQASPDKRKAKTVFQRIRES